MIQWEEVTLEEATHVEINGEVHELGIRPYDGYKSKYQVIIYDRCHIKVYMESADWQLIHVKAFPFLGIRCLRKFKPTPIEFEGEFVKFDGRWETVPEVASSAYQNCKRVKFRCVQIVEDEE